MDPMILIGIACCFGMFTVGLAQQAPYSGGTAYDGAAPAASNYGASDYGSSPSYGTPSYQGSGVYFKKPVPIDEKPIFFRTPYWLPNMYYGHYGYPWTQWFDGGPRYVIPIMSAYPNGGGKTQSYNQGYGYPGVGAGGYNGGNAAGSVPAAGSYGQSGGYGDGQYTTPESATTADPYNDNFSYYKGIPIYQTYYEKYLLKKANEASTAASA